MAANIVLLSPCQTSRFCYNSTVESQPIIAHERPRRRRLKSFVSSPPSRHFVIYSKGCTFKFRTCDNVTLRNLPGAPPVKFEEYMDDMGRVVGAVIPEKSTALRLNKEEWRIKMPVIEALFLKIQPVVDIRVTTKSNGQDYPPHVPSHIPKLCQTSITRCELQGLSSSYMPPSFNLEAYGTMYPLKHGIDGSCIIKNQLEAKVTIAFSPLLSWVPQHVMDDVVQSIVGSIVEEIKKGYSVRLSTDYRSFQRSKLKNSKNLHPPN